MTARMLRGKTVGMIGFGQIARAIALRLAGWNVTIQAYSRRLLDDAPGNVHFVGLDELLSTSDVVCVLASLNSESRGLLNADRLQRLKRDAILVNTARGAIIDEAALWVRLPGSGPICELLWIHSPRSRYPSRARCVTFRTRF